MTGPDHYQQAEKIIEEVLRGKYYTSKYSIADMLAMAQAHATLAVAAASALGTHTEGRAWADVAGTKLRGG